MSFRVYFVTHKGIAPHQDSSIGTISEFDCEGVLDCIVQSTDAEWSVPALGRKEFLAGNQVASKITYSSLHPVYRGYDMGEGPLLTRK